MKNALCGFLPALVAIAAAVPVLAAGESDLRILTYPIGLVVGVLPIDVDLGPGGQPAELYLDGEPVCSFGGTRTNCTVDVGEAPHVHILELVRRDAVGRVAAYARRWLNRPGQEAELAIQFAPRSEGGVCSGKVLWAHPLKQNPVVLEVTENGRNLIILDDGRSFRFPCADPTEPHVIEASVIFGDGRRAETVVLSGGFGGHAESGLTAVALETAVESDTSCATIEEALGSSVQRVEDTGFEVVFVLDPSAGYSTLMRSGFADSAVSGTSVTSKQYDQLVRQGGKGSEPTPKNSWKRAEASLFDAEKLWFVAPDKNLGRINGFGQGKMNWLRLLFQFGSTQFKEKPRLADAVAASGLVAAGRARQRVVVLMLGTKSTADDSHFTPEQARAYLAEVGVPLVVLRNGKLREDGWPTGIPVRNMEAMADGLESIEAELGGQCVAWFHGQVHPDQIAASLPDSVAIAGRRGEAPEDVEVVWRQAELAAVATATGTGTPTGEPVVGSRVEVTAVTVFLAARDERRRPIPDLTAKEIEVQEDGRPVTVLDLAPMMRLHTEPPTVAGAEGSDEEMTLPVGDGEFPVAVYVDRRLSGSKEMDSSLEALCDRAEWLVSLGPVEVVVADQDVRTVLGPTRRAGELREVLDRLATETAGQHAIERIRIRFLRDIRKIPIRLESGGSGMEGGQQSQTTRLQKGEELKELDRSKVLTAARSSIVEEDGVLRLAADRVTDWALATPSEDPRMLFVVGAGFDEDPVDFYLPFVERLEAHHIGRAREDFKRYRQADRVDQVGRELAMAGWTVVPVASRTAGSQSISAEMHGGDRFQAFLSASQDAVDSRSPEWLLLDPIGSQRHLAAPSGGQVVMGKDGLDRLAESSVGWYRLTYQTDRAPDGAMHELAVVTTRPGSELQTKTVVASETSEGQATVRVRGLLQGSGDQGDLPVEVVIGEPQQVEDDLLSAETTIVVDLGAIAPFLVEDGTRVVRVSLGVLTSDREPFILHRLETVTGRVDGWRYLMPLQWSSGPADLAVVVEDLESRIWGGTRIGLPQN